MFKLNAQLYQTPILSYPGVQLKGKFDLEVQQALQVVSVKGNIVPVGNVNSTTIFVCDRSSSMDGIGINTLKATFEQGIANFPDGRTVGIIIFNDSWDWLVKPTVLDAQSRQRVLKAVKGLSANGMTRFLEAVTEAVRTLKGSANEVKQLILLTDGESTVNSQQDNAGVIDLFSRDVNGSGISVEIFGMGTSYDEATIMQWAAAAGGNYYHIDGQAQNMQASIQNSLSQVINAVAGDVNIEFRTQPGVTLVSLVRKVPQVVNIGIFPSGNLAVDKMPVVNFVQGIQYEAKFEFPSAPPVQNGVPVATISLQYKSGGKFQEETFPVVVDVTADPSKVVTNSVVGDTMLHTDIAVQASQAYEQLTMAKTMGDASQADAAINALTNLHTLASAKGDQTLADLVQGMGSGDIEKARAARTQLMSAGSLDDLQRGMKDE